MLSAFPFTLTILWLQDTLEIKCDAKDKKGCSEKEVKFIDTMSAKTSDERAKELTRLSNMKVYLERLFRRRFTLKVLTRVLCAGWFHEARSEAVARPASQCFEAAPSLRA